MSEEGVPRLVSYREFVRQQMAGNVLSLRLLIQFDVIFSNGNLGSSEGTLDGFRNAKMAVTLKDKTVNLVRISTKQVMPRFKIKPPIVPDPDDATGKKLKFEEFTIVKLA